MSPQTETKAGSGFKVGVKDYSLTYHTREYVVKGSDILAAFRMTPQHRVPLEEAKSYSSCEIFHWYMDYRLDR